MEQEEMVIFQLITFGGSARSDVFEAYAAAKAGKFEDAQALVKSAGEALLEAHKVQTDLIQQEAAGNNMTVKLLMVHAQDHLMTSILAKDLIENMIDMQKQIQELQSKI
ncbi:MAG: PTS lactose/cellobiose transporter subunit IIA [Negativicutes bacterium]|jgi:PTS system cellobiose-specific IIA component